MDMLPLSQHLMSKSIKKLRDQNAPKNTHFPKDKAKCHAKYFAKEDGVHELLGTL